MKRSASELGLVIQGSKPLQKKKPKKKATKKKTRKKKEKKKVRPRPNVELLARGAKLGELSS